MRFTSSTAGLLFPNEMMAMIPTVLSERPIIGKTRTPLRAASPEPHVAILRPQDHGLRIVCFPRCELQNGEVRRAFGAGAVDDFYILMEGDTYTCSPSFITLRFIYKKNVWHFTCWNVLEKSFWKGMAMPAEVKPFDFDFWKTLSARDPVAFERLRKDLIDEEIRKAPERLQRRMRGLQWQIDVIRQRYRDPLVSCTKLFEMMWEQVYGKGGLREALIGAHTPTNDSSRPAAKVISLQASQSEEV
jgi:hypothetical protein